MLIGWMIVQSELMNSVLKLKWRDTFVFLVIRIILCWPYLVALYLQEIIWDNYYCFLLDLSRRVDSVKEENLKLKSENQVLGQYIENLMAASSVFQSLSPKAKKK